MMVESQGQLSSSYGGIFYSPPASTCLICSSHKFEGTKEHHERHLATDEFEKPKRTTVDNVIPGDTFGEQTLPQTTNETNEAKAVNHASQAAFLSNVVLWVMSITVCILANFPVILIASVIDQSMDVMISLLFVYTAHLMKVQEGSSGEDVRMKYPKGRKMLEPVLVIAFTAIASTLSMVVIIESIQQLTMNSGKNNAVEISSTIIIFFAASALLNLASFVYCYLIAVKTKSQGAMTLALDFRNDSMNFILAVINLPLYFSVF
jgi:divalent metal cation (Fe/Co/Zn/Cd) transporter